MNFLLFKKVKVHNRIVRKSEVTLFLFYLISAVESFLGLIQLRDFPVSGPSWSRNSFDRRRRTHFFKAGKANFKIDGRSRKCRNGNGSSLLDSCCGLQICFRSSAALKLFDQVLDRRVSMF